MAIRPEQVVSRDSELSIDRLQRLTATAREHGSNVLDFADISSRHTVTQKVLDNVATQGYAGAVVHTYLVDDCYARRTSADLAAWLIEKGFNLGSRHSARFETCSLTIAW